MSQHPKITIDVVVDKHTAKDSLEAILHSILFHRLFGTVKPQTYEVLDVTLPAVRDVDIQHRVAEKVRSLLRALESATIKKGQVALTFSEKRLKKQWFYTGEEEIPWEEWIINVEIRQPKSEEDRLLLHQALAKKLRIVLQTVLTHTSSERGRAAVPLISSAKGISPFPFSILVQVNGMEVG